MSLNFKEPITPEAKKMMKELFGEPEAMDDQTALFNKQLASSRREMTELANAAKQPVSMELNDIGDIKVMSDGTRYKCTKTGWKKMKCPFCGGTELVAGDWSIDDREVDALECESCKAGAPLTVWEKYHAAQSAEQLG